VTPLQSPGRRNLFGLNQENYVVKNLALLFQSVFLDNACPGHGSASRGVTNEQELILRGGGNGGIGFISTQWIKIDV
jgi:hypothetical protein